MTIYVDVLIFTNVLINYCVLSVSKVFLHINSNHFRMIISSIVGALFSLLVFVPIYNTFLSYIFKLAVAFIMCLIGFGYSDIKTYIKYIFTVFMFCTIFGGVMILFYQVVKPANMAIINDIVYFHIKPSVVVIISIGIYISIILFQRIFRCDIENTLVNLKIRIKNTEYECLGKIDTGNSVVEPFSGAPVIIAEKSILKDLSPVNKRVVLYKTLDNDGMLYAVKADKIFIDKKEINKEIYVGIYNGVIDTQIKAIINSEILR